ncbi:AGE family epimerase/isomerase [Pseudoroseicyclus aestuarii]|uniref:Mannose/cellobiose epimerase-like protein (N-acyl-D-glucosamine 2-epimerase family) n=1 Tax=Pseudoroseicyclus aestuarii TaxID=1795041 RepID=A0A318SNQ3_9RHOB|nr:AGE family epimerase/isomerase [Pseudoroseicyclus aestuarii]PYE82443.1 mannose/cellobiose epimerase-like protein (N-acyl-D-glucosamine 2-epimerase family) [Pseudoroseicyclus aestuarii]
MSADSPTFHAPGRIAAMKTDALRQLAFFGASLRPGGRLATLDHEGRPLEGPQELITTTRLVHSYALGMIAGAPGCADIVDAGMQALLTRHLDPEHGGFLWSFDDGGPVQTDKLAYGHMFVLLAAATAKAAGHADADRLMSLADAVIAERFWDAEAGLMVDEYRRDWTPFSEYRGMNANMHGVEAHLSAYEATGETRYLDRAMSILDFFVGKMGAGNDWRLPEHYHQDWSVDADYEGNPMFRPRGTTPGHSFELGRLLLQAWDLQGRPEGQAPARARALIETALSDAAMPEGGFCYTLNFDGSQRVTDRYWWPQSEAIGALATLLKLQPDPEEAARYEALWQDAERLFIDEDRGGWNPEIDDAGRPVEKQFTGKPDIYHALQADLYPLHGGLSRHYDGIAGILAK